MASNALASFESNLTEVDRLFEFHRDAGGGDRGQRVGFEVINKSAIVLTCACWEAFIEDLCIETASQLTKQIQGPDNVPQSLRESCAEYLSSKKPVHFGT